MDDTGSKKNELSREEIAKNWEPVAREFLERERSKMPLMRPEPAGVLIKWQEYTYVGGVQVISPEFSEEIVVLSMSTYPLPIYLADAIRKLDPGRLELEADEKLDMTGRQHVLRREGNKLTYMTPEQTAYMLQHPLQIYEI